tara:strand:+ start:440 stop:586 length:147 start_codon:yes stop_codon:yes gene_type:complete
MTQIILFQEPKKGTQLAQSVERRTFNPVVMGSSPILGDVLGVFNFKKN